MTDTIRWGILATGGIAADFTQDLRLLPDAEVVAVGSRTAESARAFADRFGIPRAHGSWAELAADEDVDIVYVATPTTPTTRPPRSAWKPDAPCCARSPSH
jgi:predicted dehydrogenase